MTDKNTNITQTKIRQSRRNLTRNERRYANCMVHEGYTNDEINRYLAWYQYNNHLPLRLLSASYTDRIRSQFDRLNRALDTRKAQALYGIDMLEAGYSWSGTDVEGLLNATRRTVDDLRIIYLDENNEATR